MPTTTAKQIERELVILSEKTEAAAATTPTTAAALQLTKLKTAERQWQAE